VYFEDSEIRALVTEFSERLRRDPRVRPALDRLVGNRWLEAEQSAESFLNATLFLTGRPAVDRDFFAQAVEILGQAEIDAMAETMLDCALLTFPLQSAAAVVEVTEMLATAIGSVALCEEVVRPQRLNDVYSRLSTGTLMSRF
jgi:hypothetical protein